MADHCSFVFYYFILYTLYFLPLPVFLLLLLLLRLFYQVLRVGESGTLVFEKPTETLTPPGWKYTIKPSIPHECPGNLVLQIRRPKGDTRPFNTCPKPREVMPIMQTWLSPDASDLSWRRLIALANNIVENAIPESEIHRYIMAHDLRENLNHGLFDGMTPEQEETLRQILFPLTPVQREAFAKFQNTKHKIVQIQAPPGTGKTTTLISMIEACDALGVEWMACAHSNEATDNIVEKLAALRPDMPFTRYHSYESEAGALRQHGDRMEEPLDQASEEDNEETGKEESEKAPEDKPLPDKTTEEEAELEANTEDEIAWFTFITNIAEQDFEWNTSKRTRRHFHKCGLHIRAMQNVGLLDHEFPQFAIDPEQDIRANFRRLLKAKNFSKDKPPEERKAYKNAVTELIEDII